MKFGTKVIIALALLANLWFVSSCNNGPKRELWMKFIRIPVLCRIGEYRR